MVVPLPSEQTIDFKSSIGFFPATMDHKLYYIILIKSYSPLNESLSGAERKAKIYYASCLDVNRTVEKLGAAPLLTLMREFGGWAVSTSAGVWNEREWNFQRTLEKIHSLGLSNFFNMWVGEDEKNPAKNILQVRNKCGLDELCK